MPYLQFVTTIAALWDAGHQDLVLRLRRRYHDMIDDITLDAEIGAALGRIQ